MRDEVALRRVFERAVGNFLKKRLVGSGWKVATGERLDWRADAMSPGLASILPGMVTDIVLENAAIGRRIVVDTKYAAILHAGRYDREVLKSGYLYQVYAYLRTQADRGGLHASAEGVLLHPSVGNAVDEEFSVHGHRIRFLSVDLSAGRVDIETMILSVVDFCS